MITTIEEKIDLFTHVIFEKVEKQSKERFEHAIKGIEERFIEEKEQIERAAQQIEEGWVKKADAIYAQSLSRARKSAKQGLFQKKDELQNRTMQSLKAHAEGFVKSPEYIIFLQKAVRYTVSEFRGEEMLHFYFTPGDLESLKDLIQETIEDCLTATGAVFMLHETKDEILGGCFCTNDQTNRRAVYTVASLLEDNADKIGEILRRNLQLQVV